ncbi:MAG TPA: hypothetical protein VEL76_04805 [Gemmataceae bacterium]|nr:hypothetical protein [Gemmataceae bacterium]
MMRLPPLVLPTAARQTLQTYQREVDGEPTYFHRVEAADRLFKSRNNLSNRTFRVVRSKLHEMCSGARRCCYCEDSCADEIEHVRPKSLYPERVFVWENYLYACGPCNGPKNNRYAVFVGKRKRLVPVTRGKDDPVKPPPTGTHVFIDPRSENPLDYMELDLLETFRFVPTAEEGTVDYLRADYTIKVLRLNDRDVLPEARRCAFGSYRARLHEYRSRKHAGTSLGALQVLIRGIQKCLTRLSGRR